MRLSKKHITLIIIFSATLIFSETVYEASADANKPVPNDVNNNPVKDTSKQISVLSFDWILPVLLNFSWIGLLIYVGIFVGTPLIYGQQHFIWKAVESEKEKQEYRELKSHTMTLAGFTMAALAIIMALPNQNTIEVHRLTIFYFSISLMSFFCGSYLFDYRIKRIFPYMGQVGEFTGILSLGLGFLSFANTLFKNDFFVLVIYIIFMIAITIISFVEIYYVKKFFEPECPICKSRMKKGICSKNCKTETSKSN